jgi:uncharacterized protein (DUF433 family)
VVETVRRYSKLPHLWSLSKRLARWLETSGSERDTGPAATMPHVHKLSQRLSDETVTVLVRDYQAGASLTELQRTYSLGRSSVQKLLRYAGIRRRRKSLTDAEIVVLAKKYEAGFTIREIATELGLPRTTVQDALKKSNVVKRPSVRRSVRQSEESAGPPSPREGSR